MPITINYNKGTKAVTVTVTLTADAQTEKAGLEKGAIENHLLTRAANECQVAASRALDGMTAAQIDAEAAAQKAAVDAEAARKKAAALTSNVTPNPK